MKFEENINIRIDAAETTTIEADSREDAITKAKEIAINKYENEIACTEVCMEYMEATEDYCIPVSSSLAQINRAT